MKTKNLFIAVIFIFSFFYTYINCDAQTNRIWATYYGASDADYGLCAATDHSGNVYMSGKTYSTSGIASGGFQNVFGGGGEDAYLIKFNSAGNRIWATYCGGNDNDEGDGVTTDNAGYVYLVGATVSTSGIASGGYQNVEGGGADAFLVKMDASGNRLWATFFGGSDDDYGYCVRVDASSNIYIAGRTSSMSGIASGGFQNTYGGGSDDAFLAKFNAAGNLLWATYYGGNDEDRGSCIAIDPSGNVYLGGYTNSTNGIASGGFQNVIGGDYDAFLVKFDASGNRIWGTYYGGSGTENNVYSIATDKSGNVYLSGTTNSTSGIASGGFQNTYGGGSADAFLVKFNSAGNRLWATYYGGTNEEYGKTVATDTLGHVYLAGDSYSSNNISSSGFQNSLIGTSNSFVVAFDSLGNRLCATYYGQSTESSGCGTADGSGNFYITGNTISTSGIASGGFQNTFGGGSDDAFLVKFSACFSVLSTTTVINSKTCAESCTGSATVTASGGTAPYSYLWNTTPPQTAPTADSLCAGTYTVTITDGSGNTVTSSVVITHYPTSVVTISEDTATLSLICHPSFVSYQWYLNGTLIAGATSQTYTPTHNGNYTVVAIDSNGCVATCIKYGVNWLGITEFIDENNILIFPNPANDVITIEMEDLRSTIFEVLIVDIVGNIILEKTLYNKVTNIDVSTLAKGLYFVKVKTEKGIAVKKFIKE